MNVKQNFSDFDNLGSGKFRLFILWLLTRFILKDKKRQQKNATPLPIWHNKYTKKANINLNKCKN